MKADRRLYLDRTQSRLVEEADTASAWLLAAKGQEIAPAEVKRLGLVMHEGRVMQGYPETSPVMPEPAVEMTPEPPAAPEVSPIMPSQSRRSRRKS
jgi:hypothetical protein